MKHIFLDIDGTFLNPKNNEVPQSTLDAINQAIENGHCVYLCTGRPTSSMKRFFQYSLSGFVCAGGSYIKIGDSVLFEKTLSKDEIKHVQNVCDQNHCGYVLEGKEYNYNSKLGAIQFMEAMKSNSFGTTWDEVANELGMKWLDEFEDDEIFKVSFYSTEVEVIERMRKELGSKFNLAYTVKGPNEMIEVEIFSAGCNKADAIKRVVEHHNQSLDDAIGIGDSMNDYEMIQECNPGIAMGNACQEVKDIADYITKDVDQDGIEHAFKEFNLI
ncbi:HAD family hydrolase [Anaerorhabdus sp.]|uniref:HAD family hydrolase n=1 Tax=Anaerorhabdus sp. TaxID=1872524 RepID=UPI002FC799D5